MTPDQLASVIGFVHRQRKEVKGAPEGNRRVVKNRTAENAVLFSDKKSTDETAELVGKEFNVQHKITSGSGPNSDEKTACGKCRFEFGQETNSLAATFPRPNWRT